MFIEGRNGVHVDVATKLIICYDMGDKTYKEALRAVGFISDNMDL